MDDDKALLLQISYDLNRLKAQSDKAAGIVDTGLSKMEQRAKKAARELEESLSFKNVSPSAAMTNVLGGLKQGALGAATKDLGMFGGALGALGPVGLIAAAGVAAAGAAIDRSMNTAQWALELTHASTALGLTTTQLQLFDFIATSAGIPVDKMRESMGGLEKQIGLVESGLARSMSVKAFTDGLKITPEQLRGWGTLDKQLPHIIDAAAKLNVEERAGLASRLKVDPEVLDSLIEARDGIADLTEKAKEYGIVMDEAGVKKSAEAAKEMKVAGAIISGELNVAFADLAPLAVAGANALVQVVTGITDVMRGVEDAVKPIENFIGLLDKIPGLSAVGGIGGITQSILGAVIPGYQGISGLLGMAGAAGKKDRQSEAARVTAELAAGPPATPPATVLSHGTKHHKKGGSGAHGETTAATDLDNADKLLADAEKALATSIEARAKFEDDALVAEAKKAADKLRGDLKAAKTPAERGEITKAQGETAQAFALKRKLLADQTAQALADQANTLAEIGIEGQQSMLEAERGLGGTTARRAEIARKLFDLDEQIQEAKLAEIIASKTASDAEKEQARLRLANLQASAPQRKKAVDNEAGQSVTDQQNALAEAGLQGQTDMLTAEKDVAKTTQQRRTLALQLFALDEQLQELKLQEVISSKTSSDAEKQRAKAELANLQATVALREQATSEANPGNSWSGWLQSAKASISDVGEAFAQMRVQGIEAFNQSLFTSEGKLNSFGNVARSVARSAITNFEQFGVKAAEVGLFGGGNGGGNGLLGGLMGGGSAKGGGGILGSLLGKAGLGGGKAPTGTAGDPLFVQMSGSGSAGGLLGGLGGGAGGGVAASGNPLAGLSGAAAGGGGVLQSIMGGLGHIFGFKDGGSFTVGGARGIDQNLAVMKVTKGERVDVSTPGQQKAWGSGRGTPNQTFVFPNTSVDGFKKSQRQVARTARMATQYGS